MSDIVISVENLSKRYLVGHQSTERERYTALRDVIARETRKFARKAADLVRGRQIVQGDEVEEFWALKDVNFEVKQGEVLGIIGRNGAGKSTLLKILSRITEPSVGRIKIKGRVASLLEVGTGFHGELTGRENIFLNGAILGMTKAEIRKKFDEIVAFAEVQQFIDTPIKHYSSGMYVRLAFAVAAHLDAEILIIDEVLAVGDAQFQRKCMDKMNEVSSCSRTILFVSHNMPAVNQLCNRAIWLHDHRIASNGRPAETVQLYLTEEIERPFDLAEAIRRMPADPVFRLLGVRFTQQGRILGKTVAAEAPFEVEISYQVLKPTFGLRVVVHLCDEFDTILLRSCHDENMERISQVEPGHYVSTVIFPAGLLGPTFYRLKIRAAIHNDRYCMPPDDVTFSFRCKTARRVPAEYANDQFLAKLAPSFQWQTERVRE